MDGRTEDVGVLLKLNGLLFDGAGEPNANDGVVVVVVAAGTERGEFTLPNSKSFDGVPKDDVFPPKD